MARVGVDAALLPRVDTIDPGFIEALLACNGGVECAVATRGFFDGRSIVDVLDEGSSVTIVFSRDVLSTNQWLRFALALAGWELRGVDVESFDAGWAAAAVDAARLAAALIVAPELLDVAAGMLATASRVRGRLVLDASTSISVRGNHITVDAIVEASRAYTVNLKIRGVGARCVERVESVVDGGVLIAAPTGRDEVTVTIIVEKPLSTKEARRLLEPLAKKTRCG